MPDMMYPGFRGMLPSSLGGQMSPLQPGFPGGNPIMGMPPPGTPGVGAGFANPGGGMGGGPLQGGMQTGTGGPGPGTGTGMPPIMQMPPPGGPTTGGPFGPTFGGNPIMGMPMPGGPGTGTGMSPIARQLLMQRFAQPQAGGYAGRDLFPAAMMNRYNMT